MDWTSYHPVADMQDYMAYLVDTYSDFISVVSIGKSYEGNDMQVRGKFLLKIGLAFHNKYALIIRKSMF
jgi:hypothetical protein